MIYYTPVDSLIIYWLFRLAFESSGWHGRRKRRLKRGSELATAGQWCLCPVFAQSQLPQDSPKKRMHITERFMLAANEKGLFPISEIFTIYFSFVGLETGCCYFCLIIYKLGILSTDCSLSSICLILGLWQSLG